MSDAVLAILSPIVPIERRHLIDTAATFKELGLDPIDVAGLAMDIEDALEIRLDDDIINGWSTVADVAASIAKREKAGQR